MSSVADVIIETLEQAGVERIYGVVGDSLNGLTESLRTRETIKWIHVRHEEVAAFAASGEAQLTGKLAVCAGSCGPGNLHLINGLYDAQRSRTPVLAIAAHIPSGEIGGGYFQETHPQNLFRECSVYCELVSDPAQMPFVLENAIRASVGERGVAVIVIPGDVALKAAPKRALTKTRGLLPSAPVVRPTEADIDVLAALLNGFERVTLFCGRGCSGAHAPLMELAEALKSPIVHALGGKEHVEYDNPYDVGLTGFIGFSSGYAAMHTCEVLLMLGTDFPYKQFIPTDVRVAQVDIRPGQLGRRAKLEIGIVGDVGETIRALLPKLRAKSDRRHLDENLARYKSARKGLDELAAGHPWAQTDTPAISSTTRQRSRFRGRRFHLRRGYANDLGGTVRRNERSPPPDRIARPRLDGERDASGDRCSGGANRPSGHLAVWRRRLLYVDGRPDHVETDEPAGENRDLQQWRAWLRCTGDEGVGVRRERHRSG